MTAPIYKKYSSRYLIIIFLFTFINCSSNEEKLDLATFSDGNVEIDEYLDHYLLSTQYKPDNFPTEENLKNIVFNKALEKMSIQEAHELNIEQDSLYVSVLKNNERRLLFQRYVQEEFTKKIITDSLINKFYAEFSPQFKLKYIMRPFLRTSSEGFIESQRKTIEEAYKQLLNGKSFEKVVEEYSQDVSTNKKGGDLGWVIRESLGDEKLRLVMDTLSDNTYSKPFKGYGGFYIMFKGEKRVVKVPQFEEVKNSIWKTLYRSRKAYIEDAVNKRFEELKNKYNYVELKNNIADFIGKFSPNSNISDSTPLNFENMDAKDKSTIIANYYGGSVIVDDLFADSKKAPTNKYEFMSRLTNLGEQHLFAKHAFEIDLQNTPDLKDQLSKMKSSLLSSILYKRFVKDPAEKELANYQHKENFNKVKARSEIESKLRTEFENRLKSKYNFKYVSGNFSEALKIANNKKKSKISSEVIR